MKRILIFSILCMLLFSLAGVVQPVAASAPHTYTVLVGSENTRMAISIMSFFPGKVTVHVGDSVVWKANSHEIHTVSFLAGAPMPDFIIPSPDAYKNVSPLAINPLAGLPIAPANGMYDGTTYVNSGILSTDPGNATSFQLTFTKAGKFPYVCIVHGMMMSGEVDVVNPSVHVPSPSTVNARAKSQIAAAWRKAPGVLRDAFKTIKPPTRNSDGTRTWNVSVGYSSGVYDVMRFFPSVLPVKPGDTVLWTFSKTNVAPHTITFLNGNPDPELVQPVPQPAGPPVLLLNPQVLFPSVAVMNGTALNKTDYFNSGLLNPSPTGTTFSLKVGSVSGVLNYICLLHDTSGMVAKLIVDHDR